MRDVPGSPREDGTPRDRPEEAVAGVGELKAVAGEIADAGAYYLRRGRAWLRNMAHRARHASAGGEAAPTGGRPARGGLEDGFVPGSYGYGGEGRHAVEDAVDGPRHDDGGHRREPASEQLARAYRAQGLPSQRGRGPRGYARADERILEEINERLCDDPIVDASDIVVRCEQGRVVLEGHVPVRWMKHRAEDIADAVSGAKEVDNRIRVGAPGPDAVGPEAVGSEAGAAPRARSGGDGGVAPSDRVAHGAPASTSSSASDGAPGASGAPLPPPPQSPH